MEPFDGAWRAEREAVQQQAVPGGSVTLSCSAPFGGGGLGRHLQEIWGALGRGDARARLVCGPSDEHRGVVPPPGRVEVHRGRLAALADRAFGGFPAWATWKSAVDFDRAACRRLGESEHLLAFNGQALAQLRKAQEAGYASASLVSATAHMRHVAARQLEAYRRHPLERPWAPRVLERNLAEYERADSILYATEYIRDSFLAEGVPAERLRAFPLTPDPRYTPRERPPESAGFEVLYVGSLSVSKGVPLLVESVRCLDAPELRLVLLGGWASRGMRRFLTAACQADPRIEVRLGDPLERLRSASLYVHPSWDDGFGYSPAEALAAGVPTIVTEDTGMKELIAPGRGVVVPTGDGAALAEAIEAAYRREILTI
jgi:glycosyltransferase involved in cell wall biosynthesis